ncbi:acyl-CoA dehydrogenase family protein [Novosphingobium bradum]|uniref:Acyl-CoA dehydrogenase family protein n=1 Tax=Novosphingobium bradum TaxID=1737444 RepID=A0ABV7IJF4_9SPHN
MAQIGTEDRDTAEERAFRLKAREHLKAHLPPRVADEPHMDWEDKALVARDRQIQRALWDGGLAGIMLPTEYGGQGLSRRHSDIFYEEAQPYRLAWHFGNAFNIVLPVLLAHGTEDLKKTYIPAMLRGDHIWCQLLSEPSGGSDLAGVIMRAEHKDGKWVLNGSKVWTTGGMDCDMGMCLARTDWTVPKHSGLTMFVVDMKAPGVTITPLKLIDGGQDFCQEFFDDVAVADDHVIGKVNDGWHVAGTQLASERAGMARGWHEGVAAAVEVNEIGLDPSYAALARELGVAEDPRARQLIGEAYVIDAVYKLTTRRVGNGIMSRALPPTAGAVSSLMAARVNARRCALMSELAGPAGVAVEQGSDPRIGMLRVTTHRIGGGTTEMQLNSVSERYLGLPREADVSRDLPFNQLRHNAARPG